MRPTDSRKGTFFGRLPIARIDHIFVGDAIAVEHVEIPSSSLARVTSDHLPLVADLRLDAASEVDVNGMRKHRTGSDPAVNLGI